ncbi:hypothetical protein MMC10_001479 [Thelotrema lepadinum]|nr:hypothetical protein [Thelotrema lepadinum]
MLCNVCQSIFQKTFQLDNSSGGVHRWVASFYRPRPLSEIRISAGQDRCYACISVLKQWDKRSFGTYKDGDDLQLRYTLKVPTKVSESQLFIGLYHKDIKVASIVLWLVDAQTHDNIRVSPTIGVNTGSPETFKFLLRMVSECNDHHLKCSNTRKGTNWYPTRLIDVGIAGDALEQDTVKLIITPEMALCGPYASLSHCWGKSQTKRLKQENLESMKKEILLCDLPKTFQDAAVVCRALNIRYIWIDSLCIVQDSHDDWHHEARRMFHVYKNAFVNIAATSASGGQVGLFQERDIRALGAEPLCFEEGILRGQWRLLDRSHWSESIDRAVLNTRAWVVQERHLSSRIIHFGSNQVFWDCCSLAACEIYPSGVPNWSSSYGGGLIYSQESSALVQASQSVEQTLGHWGRIVEVYSASDLTFQKDKIIALSGIVELTQQLLQDEFCAGLWRTKIEVQLAWLADQGSSKRRRSVPLRAPTWSWLSMITPVQYVKIDGYRDYDVIERATVTEVKLENNTPDEKTGEVTTGYLRMRCILNSAKLRDEDGSLRFLEPGVEDLQSSICLDTIGETNENETLYFIPLFDVQFDTWGKPPRKASQTRGILTKPVVNYLGTYQRVGHAHVIGARREPSDEEFSPDYVAIRTAKGKEMLPCEEYDANLGHLIKLV